VSWLDGAWQRVSVSVDGACSTEVSDVWWLMAGGYFADFRRLRDGLSTELPYSQTQAFGGTYRYDPATEQLAWHHFLDSIDRDPDIQGTIRPDPDNDRLMHEVGEGFSEVWARLDTAGSARSATFVDGVLTVRCGSYAIVLDGNQERATRSIECGDGWVDIDVLAAALRSGGDRPPSE
jgi:hypothetical protein